MAKSGVKPKPTNLKIIDGVGKHRINQDEPKPKPVAPNCPAWLSKVAKTEWKRVRGELVRLGLLTRMDRAALAAYCDAYSRWVEASQHLQKDGMIITAPSGYPVQSPYLSIINTAIKDMKAFLIEFGMTPSSRSRISVKTEDSKTDDL